VIEKRKAPGRPPGPSDQPPLVCPVHRIPMIVRCVRGRTRYVYCPRVDCDHSDKEIRRS
jgi:hypothetical protein